MANMGQFSSFLTLFILLIRASQGSTIGNDVEILEKIVRMENKFDRQERMWTATLEGYRQELHYLRAENEALSVAACPEGEVVAFKAIHAKDLTVEKNQILVFKDYVMNHGNAYDNLTGIFVAPTKGLYLFSGQICSHIRQSIIFGLMVNYNAYMRDSPYDNITRECSTFTEPIDLSEGDRVWVQAFRDNDNIYEDEHRWSSFAGILIRNI